MMRDVLCIANNFDQRDRINAGLHKTKAGRTQFQRKWFAAENTNHSRRLKPTLCLIGKDVHLKRQKTACNAILTRLKQSAVIRRLPNATPATTHLLQCDEVGVTHKCKEYRHEGIAAGKSHYGNHGGSRHGQH